MKNYSSIDAYIKEFPKEDQAVLESIRSVIHTAAPFAVEAIKYGMPTFRLNNKNLVHFASFKNHFGFYPAPSGIASFKKELAPYVHSKGAIQFPKDKPVPLDLIAKIVKARVQESQEK